MFRIYIYQFNLKFDNSTILAGAINVKGAYNSSPFFKLSDKDKCSAVVQKK